VISTTPDAIASTEPTEPTEPAEATGPTQTAEPAKPGGREPSLRRQWSRAFTILVVVSLVSGIAAFTGTQVLVARFSQPARQLEHETAAIHSLRESLLDHETAAHALLQGDPASKANFAKQQDMISKQFADALALFPANNGTRPMLEQMRTRWQAALVKIHLWGDQIPKFVTPSAADLVPGSKRPTAVDGRAYSFENDSLRRILDDLSEPSLKSMDRGLRDAARVRTALWAFLAALFVLDVGVTLYFRRRMVVNILRPIARTHEGVVKIRGGNLDHRIEVGRRDELGQLGEAFNEMAESLRDTKWAMAVLTRDTEWQLKTEREAAERESLVRFEAMVEGGSDVVLLTDGVRTLAYASPNALHVLGLTAELGQLALPDDVVHPSDAPVLERMFASALASGRSGPEELRVRGEGASWKTIEVSLVDLREVPEVGAVLWNVRDVSERAALELELRHAQKLESVGRLAAGVAHEINTPVQVVGANLQFLDSTFAPLLALARDCRDLADSPQDGGPVEGWVARIESDLRDVDVDYLGDEVPAALTEAVSGIDRVATIVRAMREFGDVDSEALTPVDVNEAIETTLAVIAGELDAKAEVVRDLGDLPSVMCSRGGINSVLLAVLTNAVDAVEATGRRGTIRVSTTRTDDAVVVAVADDGCGIGPEIEEKVFDQFFTTKEVGKGTGQGLALARAVVERHDGRIWFEHHDGAGTTFFVSLPVDRS